MKNHKEEIFNALIETGRFKRVSMQYPNDFSVIPCATIAETKKPIWADDMIYMWEKSYDICIWAKSAEEAEELTEVVIDALDEIRLTVACVADTPIANMFRKDLSFFG